MKNIFISITILLSAVDIYGQNNSDTIPFKDMMVPSSPAFNLLDVAPTTVERPATVKQFAISIANAIGHDNGFPKNFAMEFAPYWLFKHPHMSIFRYNGIKLETDPATNNKKLQNYSQNIFYGVKNVSVSVATVSKDSGQDIHYNANYLGFSLRTNLINVRRKLVVREIGKTNIQINSALAANLVNANSACAVRFDLSDTSQIAAFHKCLNDFPDSLYSQTINSKNDYLDTLVMIRPIFTLDFALASSIVFGNNNFSTNHRYRTGGWFTVNLSIPLGAKTSESISNLYNNKNYLNVYGIARLVNEDSTGDFKTFTNYNFLDLGGRLEFELNRFAISFESVYRTVNPNDKLNSSRNVGIVQYKVNDNLYLTGTFGKNFGDQNNLVAFLGINWGLGTTSLYKRLDSQ